MKKPRCNASLPSRGGRCKHPLPESGGLCRAGHDEASRRTARSGVRAGGVHVPVPVPPGLPGGREQVQAQVRNAKGALAEAFPGVRFDVTVEASGSRWHTRVSYTGAEPDPRTVAALVRDGFGGVGSGPGMVDVRNEVPVPARAEQVLVSLHPELRGDPDLPRLGLLLASQVRPDRSGNVPQGRLRLLAASGLDRLRSQLPAEA